MPFDLLSRAPAGVVPLHIIHAANSAKWRRAQPPERQLFFDAIDFRDPVDCHLIPADGGRPIVACIIPDRPGLWDWAALADKLPPHAYRLADPLSPGDATSFALAWALASYRFSRYRKAQRPRPQLVWPAGADRAAITAAAAATHLARDLVNTPAQDMAPPDLADAVKNVARGHNAKVSVVVGPQLLKQNYPGIHTVGRASVHAPRLITMTWGRQSNPHVVLVGKGVCFDSGGLDLKPAAGMLIMKKDMGGAANALGLAAMVMAANLPVRLTLLIAAVENAVSGDAFHPMDIITMRDGTTVEVGNTDAEGRLVLADCLTRAGEIKPSLIIDFATLTGAARVALGTELPAMFANDDDLAAALLNAGDETEDPLWRLPLHAPYRRLLDCPLADISSTGKGGYAGAIIAALFLQHFVPGGIPWAHFDVMAWNLAPSPGRPEGGEAMAMRAAFAMLQKRFRKPNRRGK